MPGLDRTLVDNEVDWTKALASIKLDIRSDFVLSPHFDFIYNKNSDRLIESACQSLRSGQYSPRLPITFSVPKSNLLTRPGSILEPRDRLIHQGIVESMLGPIEQNMNRDRTFSQVITARDGEIFEPSHESWDKFQKKIREISSDRPFVLKADIANYFETIPQHSLINLLSSTGIKPEFVSLLEEQLLSFRQRSSSGIIQGIYPSDILGNFYLSDFDADCEMHGLPSARYVDDIYVGFQSESEARRELVRLNDRLRKNGLFLNPQKTTIMSAADTEFEENELERLFDEAREEIWNEIDWLRASGYGFQGDWIVKGEEPDEREIELIATKKLLAAGTSDSQKEKIERFCLPVLRGADDDSAVDLVFENFLKRPQLTRLYSSYLTHFSRKNDDIRNRVGALMLMDDFFCDYQRMYMIASILNCDSMDGAYVVKCHQWFESGEIGSETRALCAIFVSKFGSPQQVRSVRLRYESEPSEYVRSAILYSAQFFSTAERRTAKRAWGGHSDINALISDVL